MKLHLPSSLRKALLTCLAALTSLLPATLASGAFLSSGAFCSLALAEDAVFISADDEEDDDPYGIMPFAWVDPGIEFPTEANANVKANATLDLDTIEATNLYASVGGDNNPFSYTGGAGKNLKINKAGPNITTKLAGEVHVTNLWLTSGAPFTANSNNNTFAIRSGFLTSDIQNIYVNNVGFNLEAAATGLAANFYFGKIAPIGSGQKGESGLSDGGSWTNITVKLNSDANLETTGTLYIQEDISTLLSGAYLKAASLAGSGSWTIGGTNSANSYFEFTNGGSLDGRLIFANVNGNTTRAHKVKLGNSLQLGGIGGNMGEFDATGVSGVKVTVTGTGGEASKVTMTNVTLALGTSASQSFTDSSFDSGITLGEGSSLTLRGNSDVSGVLTLEGDATLSLSLAGDVSFSNLVADGHTLTLNITDFASLQNGTYVLFAEGYESSSVLFTPVTSGHKTANIDDQGQLVVSSESMQWNQAGGAWTDETSLFGGSTPGAGWQLNGSDNWYTNGDNAIFDHETGGTMTLSGQVVANDLTINNGDWIFDASASGSSLSVNGSMNVGAHNVTLQGGAFTIASLSGSGTVNYAGSSLSLLDGTGFTGTLELTANYSLGRDIELGDGAILYVNAVNFGMTTHRIKADVKLNTANYGLANVFTMGNGAVLDGNLIITKNTYTGANASGAGNESRITGNIKAEGEGASDFILDMYAEDQTNFSLVIEGTLEGFHTIRLQRGRIKIAGGLSAETMGSTSFTLSGRNSGNDGNLTVSGEVSGITEFNVTGTVGTTPYLIMDGTVTLGDSTTFNVVPRNNPGNDVTYITLSGTINGDASSDIIKTGNGKLNITGTVSSALGVLDIQQGEVNLGSAVTFSGLKGAGSLNRSGDSNIQVTIQNSLQTSEDVFTGTIGDGVTVDVTGGYWKFNGTLDGALRVSGGALAVVGNSVAYDVTMAGGSLSWEGDALTMNGALSIEEGSTFTVDAGKQLTVANMGSGTNGTLALNENAVVTLSNAASLTGLNLAAGSRASLASGTYSINRIEAAGGSTIHIGLTGTESAPATVISGLEEVVRNGADKIVISMDADDVKSYVNAHATEESISYSLFTDWDPTWNELFDLDIGGLGGVEVALDDEGNITFAIVVKDLLWNGGVEGVWTQDGEGWKLESGRGESFATYDNVTFAPTTGVTQEVHISGTVSTSLMTIEGEGWNFQDNGGTADKLDADRGGLVMSDGSSATFSGVLQISASAVKLGSNATLTLSNTGAKALGAVTLGAMSRLVVTTAVGWNGTDTSLLSGTTGTLELRGLNLDNDHATARNAIINNLIPRWDAATGVTVGSIELTEGTDLVFGGNEDKSPRLKSVGHIYVKSGSSIDVDSATMNVGSGDIPVLHLEGTGVNGKGAFSHLVDSNRTVTWGLKLDADATFAVKRGSSTNIVAYIQYVGTYNGDRHTLTKTNTGELQFAGNFNTAERSEGAFDIQEGNINLAFTANAATALANYSFHMGDDGTLNLSGNTTYVVNAISGTGEVAASAARTLQVNNSLTAAGDENIFAGSLSNVRLEVTGGYQAVTAELPSGTVMGASGTGTLAVSGSVQGELTLELGNGGTLDMAGAKKADGAAVTYTQLTGAGTIRNLTLSGADVVGFAEATGLSGSRITLDRATLSGGTLAFGVVAAEPEDESDGAWSMGQGVSYITYGSPVTYRGSEKTTLAIDPYGRMEESGDIRVLKRGTYLLIENFGAAADLTHYTKAPTPLGRMSYTYRVADGNLYLDVVEAAGQLTWDVAQGGDWNTPNAWIFNGFTHASFRDGDVVTFTTLEEGGETVIGPVKVSIAPGETVSVGGITVTGETSYVLDGNITGIKDAEGNDIPGVKDAGLVVGTLGAEGKSFMGTLTLTGENSWLGDNVLNSGNVVVTNARALSTGITTVGSAAMLQIECGGELASTLNMQGGLLKTMEDVTVNARITSGSFSAAENTTLTIHREGGGSGRVLVNSDGSTGRVYMALDEPSAASTALTIGGGALTLSTGASSEATYTVTGAITLSGEDTALVVEEGVTLSGNVIAPQGTVTMEGGSALSVSGSGGSVGTLISHGSSLQGSSAGAGTKVGTFIADADTTLSGMWEIRSFSHEGGVLTIADGVTGITPEYDTTTGRIVVQGGAALRGGSEEAQLTIQELELSGDEGAAAALAAGSNIDTPSLSVTNGVIAAGAEVTLSSAAAKAAISGSGSVLSGVVHVLGGAQVSITDGAAMDGEIDVTNGSVSVESDAVGGTAFLSGPRAKLDFNGSAASTVVTMCSGAQLLGTGSFTGTIIVEDTNVAAGPGVYDLGGLGTGASVRLNGLRSVSSVTGLTDALNLVGDSALALGTAQRDRQNALIRFDGEGATGAYKLADGATLTVNITSILSDIMQAGSAGSTYYVFNKGISGTDWTAESVTFDADLFLYKIDVSFEEMNGSLTFSYSGPLGGVDIFYSSEEGTAGSSATLLSDYAATDRFAGVVMDRETIIDLSGKHMDADHPDGLVLRNLAMTEDGSLTVKGSNNDARPEPTLVTIRNTVKDADLEQYAEDHGLDIQNIFTVRGDVSVQDAHLKLSHIASDGTLLTGSRTRMMGDLSIAGGQLIIESGELELNKHADVEEVVFTRGTSGQLIVSGCTASVGNISLDAMEDDGAHTEHIRLENEGVLEIRTGSMVATGISIGNAEEELGGTVNIEGKSLVSAGASLQHVVLHLKDNSRLTITPAVQPRALALAEPAESSWELAGLTGGGELSAAESRNVSIRVVGEDRTYSGNLASYHGTMTIGASDYSQIFSGVLGGDGWSLTNSAGGRVTLDLMGARARNSVVMDDLTLQSGSHTQITLDMLNLTPGVTGLNLNTLYIANGANVTFAQYGEGMITLEGDDDAVQRIVLGSLTVAGDSYIGEDVLWELSGVRNYKKGSLKGGKDANGDIYLEFQLDNTNRYAKYADGENATAGANMLWGVQNATGELGALDTALSELLHLSGEGEPSAAEKAQANRVLAAAAGASTAALGEALGADLERQLRAIRNRTTSLGYGAERNSSVWLNAESNYHKQKADELLPGYKLNGWGGTVGVHTELPSVHSTVGVALTAMYNDVESDGADRIKGDMDTYYLSAFAQVAHRAWRHTFIATVGTASVDVDRTVNYGSGSYTTSGSTDGMSFGLLYEVGYTLPLRSDYSVCLQPVLNVAWKTTTIDAYTENGGNAALNVGEQSYSTITFGAGARLQAAVGSRLWNRTGLLEGRALVKVDAGDRQGEVETAFASAPEAPHGRVKSAERGAVGVELGAGITVPTGATGSVFADFSAELRADYTNLNATLGYKINF